MDATLELLTALVARPSNTPDDAGCCDLLMARLQPLGFAAEYFNAGGVTNLWASLRRGDGPLMVLAGHTDVVPTGPLDQWRSPPFEPTVHDGLLYGRGAADMKSGIAAMVTAVERFVNDADWAGTLAFLITSDEEGPATYGTQYAIEQLKARGVVPDYAIVGEASSNLTLGDRIMIGRRGSLNGRLKVLGKQGHVAYPHKVENPILRAAPVLARLAAETWDEGNADFPPTSFQISNINAGTGATNVVPGTLDVVFNFRYCTESTDAQLRQRVQAMLDEAGLRYELNWELSGKPFLTRHGALTDAASDAIHAVTGAAPERFTGGGTSDARFISPWGAQTIELGPINASIHKIDEHVRIADLAPLSRMYEGIPHRGPHRLLTPAATCPDGTYWAADSQWPVWSSKKKSGANARRNRALSRPPRNMASSTSRPQSIKVRMARSCAGALRAVTRAVRNRIGRVIPALCCSACKAASKGLKGPGGSGRATDSTSCRVKAGKPSR